MTDLRTAANEQAQAALRLMNDYRARHGKRNHLLDARYEAAERVVDAIDDFDSIDALSAEFVDEWQTAVLASVADPALVLCRGCGAYFPDYSGRAPEMCGVCQQPELPDIALAITHDLGDITVFPMGVGR
jgi:hypothetical protein